jgi:hypothetical protein
MGVRINHSKGSSIMTDRIYTTGDTYWISEQTQYTVKKDFSNEVYVKDARVNRVEGMSVAETVEMQLQLDGCI